MSTDPADPVEASRTRWRRLAGGLQRIGYLGYTLAIVLFFVGLATGFDGIVTPVLVAALIGASVILAVGIQVQYAIRGAERHEEDAAAQRRQA